MFRNHIVVSGLSQKISDRLAVNEDIDQTWATPSHNKFSEYKQLLEQLL